MTPWRWLSALLEVAMNESLSGSSERYTVALRSYLATEGEAALHAAYELGRKAVGQGLGVLGMAKIHQQALANVLLPRLGENQRDVPAVESSFMEACSPFEAQHRFFTQGNARLNPLN